MDKYYMDYRTGTVVKNLDTTFMAPELYNEIIVSDAQEGVYEYTYSDGKGNHLTYTFTMLQVTSSELGFEELLDIHCRQYNFNPRSLVRKVMFISEKQFKMLLGGKA